MTSQIQWLTIQRAAKWLGVTEQSIRNWIDDGVFPAYQMNPRSRVLIKAEDIIAAMERGRIVPKRWGKRKV